jgi:hypothetical protein
VNYNTTVNNINLVGNFKNARFISGRSGVTSVVTTDFGRRKTTINNDVVAMDRDLNKVGDAHRWLSREPSRENRQFSDRKVPDRVIRTRRENDARFVSTRPEWNGRNRNEGPRNSSDIRRADAPRNDAAPRNEPDRGRQDEGNRGRGANANNANVAAAPNRSESVRTPQTPERREAVAFPRNEPARGRQDEGTRGRGANANNANVAAAPNRSETVRRPETPERREAVVFPRNESDRGRQAEGNRGRS